jgi:hypothetical protein
MIIVENILNILFFICVILNVIVVFRIRSIIMKSGIENSKIINSLVDALIKLNNLNKEENGKYTLFLNFSIFIFLFTILILLILLLI